jgi:hypothetical protein
MNPKFGYPFINKARRIVDAEFGSQVQDIMLMYCKRNQNDPLKNPANPSTGRITIVKAADLII